MTGELSPKKKLRTSANARVETHTKVRHSILSLTFVGVSPQRDTDVHQASHHFFRGMFGERSADSW
jgi:hypothetical protein